MSKTFEFEHFGKVQARIRLAHYENNKLAVELISWESDGQYWENYARLSINTSHVMIDGDFVLNHDCNEFMPQLIAAGIIVPTGQVVHYGYVSDQPIFRLTEQAKEYIDIS